MLRYVVYVTAKVLCVQCVLGQSAWSTLLSVHDGQRISIVPLNSEPGLNPKPVIGRGL